MPYSNNNNNKNQPSSTVFSSITFSNPSSENHPSRFSIDYFNKLMRIKIARKTGTNGEYATYDSDSSAYVYLSFTKAKILLDMIQKLLEDESIHNVCVECNQGLLKVSDGIEFGAATPCISITSVDSSGSMTETVYETKTTYTGAYNYSDGQYSEMQFPDMEIMTFAMVLKEYYHAASYAIAASVHEGNMYKREGQLNLIRAIADKVGVERQSGNSNRTSFLNGSSSNSSSSSSGLSGIPQGYEQSTFEDIANSMGIGS